ncbi:hypothetical protein MPSEU_000240700 [Mayamaea pseudoterrestris]|nr:hypothetical protein MPSEU_000240700 [Mayamaea pseudoterrestris]
MAPLALPSRLEPVSVPIFAIDWFVPRHANIVGEPRSSVVAYCGGGGSAKTGVTNSIFVDCYSDGSGRKQSLVIPTDDEIGVALKIYQHEVKLSLWLAVCVKNSVRRYRLPTGESAGEIDVGEEVSTVAIHPTGRFIAIGCESGHIIVYAISKDDIDDETFTKATEVFRDDRHKKAVCCMAFSEYGGRLITSGKDGKVFIYEGTNFMIGLTCTVTEVSDPPPPTQRAPPQIIVKGCAFLDHQGLEAVTVASPRRGKAYIARWVQQSDEQGFVFVDKQVCYQHPISSFSLSADRTLIALGSSDGSVLLRDAIKWKPLKTFFEVHDFPVTCIAARPYPTEKLLGEEDGVVMAARTASADGKLACLTQQKRGPRSSEQQSSGVMVFMNQVALFLIFLALLLTPVIKEYQQKCGHEAFDSANKRRCLVDSVLLAPSSRPGVGVPPY